MSVINIHARNVGEAYECINGTFRLSQNKLMTRNEDGSTRFELAAPVVLTIARPRERILFDPLRDCNPYLQFFAALHMLNGRNDVKYLEQFDKHVRDQSDNGIVLHGATGYRIFPQLRGVVAELTRFPDSTRAAMQVWDWSRDQHYQGRDLPHELCMMFTLRDGLLDMSLTSRNRNAVWGMTGPVDVKFTMLQEYLCACIGNDIQPGLFYHFAHNVHASPDDPRTAELLAAPLGAGSDPYTDSMMGGRLQIQPFPMVQEIANWRRELGSFIAQDTTRSYSEPFFEHVAKPMMMSHKYFRERDYDHAHAVCEQIRATDWRHACQTWIDRRIIRMRQKEGTK